LERSNDHQTKFQDINNSDNLEKEVQVSKTSTSNQKIKLPSIDEDITNIKEIINPLSGYWNRQQILNSVDFERFTSYAIEIIKTGSLPNNTEKFKNTGASIEFIRKTIHLTYTHLGKKNKNVWVSLAHLFKQFENTATTTTNSKFSAYSGNYKKDIESMITF